jgi:hypothetical protein
MVVVLIETRELLGFPGAVQLSADIAILRTVVRLNAQATIGNFSRISRPQDFTALAPLALPGIPLPCLAHRCESAGC